MKVFPDSLFYLAAGSIILDYRAKYCADLFANDDIDEQDASLKGLRMLDLLKPEIAISLGERIDYLIEAGGNKPENEQWQFTTPTEQGSRVFEARLPK